MWTSHHGGPTDDQPTPEQLERWQRLMSPPENELPAGLGVTVLVAATDDVAVGLTQVEAFSTGFRFTLAVRARRLPQGARAGDLFAHASAHGPHGTALDLDDRLLLGIEYPDGRRASTLGDTWAVGPGADVEPDSLVLVPQGGGGSDLAVDQAFWVAPLPPAGDVLVVVAWPGFGIPEAAATIDGGAITAAAARSRTLWPTPPADATDPPAPPRPTSGWFADEVPRGGTP